MLTREEDIINKFREMVSKRYEYHALKERFHLGDEVTEEMILGIKNYFLNTIYPEASRRKDLEDAFRGLAEHMQQPRRIWGLFGNMAGAVIKFGRQFITALRSGFSALDSFVSAKKFESSMMDIANKNGITMPMSDEDFEDCIYQLEREEVENFISHVKSLFEAMINTKLLEKTIYILDNVAATMRHKPQLYPPSDVDGILLGKSLLQEGYNLFSKYDESTKKMIVEIIYKNEMWAIEEIFSKREN